MKMMTAFKILMLLCLILSFLGSMAEKNDKVRNGYLAAFGVSGVLFLTAEAITYVVKFMN